jgi:hypothetical protein
MSDEAWQAGLIDGFRRWGSTVSDDWQTLRLMSPKD